MDMKAARVRHINDFNSKIKSGEMDTPLGTECQQAVSVHSGSLMSSLT